MAFGPSNAELAKVEESLGYVFNDKWLLRQAFFHPSVGEFNNNRLAWIGDAVMNMAISQTAFESSSTASCEVLHDRRMVMAMREFCCEGAKKMGWDKLAMCGKSFPKKADEQNTNMLAEMFEAVWGAQFIDSKGDYALSLASYRMNFPLENFEGIFAAIAEAKKVCNDERTSEKEAAKKAKREAQLAQMAAACPPTPDVKAAPATADVAASVADLLNGSSYDDIDTTI